MSISKPISAAFLFFALVAWPPGFANAAKLGICPTVDQLDGIVISCGSNEKVTQKARECADTILGSWKLAAVALQTQLTAHAESQNATEVETRKNFDKTLFALEAQIKYMQSSTALVADYVQVMVDDPESREDATSMSCFNDNFHAVERIVKELDGEIIRAKGIHAMVADMRAKSSERHAKFDKSIFEGVMSGKMVVVKYGESANGASDVTGIREDKEKQLALGSSLLRKPGTRKIGRESGASELSGRSEGGAGNGFAGADAMTESFSEALTQPASRPIGQVRAEDESAIAGIWAELQESTRNGALASSIDSIERKPGVSAKNSEGFERELSTAGTSRSIASLRVAGSEINLFELVSKCYRKTELFRSSTQ